MDKIYIDVRHEDTIDLLSECSECKKEYAMRLHLRHLCGDCRSKELNDIFHPKTGIFGDAWKKMWENFDRLMGRI